MAGSLPSAELGDRPRTMPYLLLAGAIVAEIFATTIAGVVMLNLGGAR